MTFKTYQCDRKNDYEAFETLQRLPNAKTNSILLYALFFILDFVMKLFYYSICIFNRSKLQSLKHERSDLLQTTEIKKIQLQWIFTHVLTHYILILTL